MVPVTYTNKTWMPCRNVLFRYADGVEATLWAKFNIDFICIQIFHPRILISSGVGRNAQSVSFPWTCGALMLPALKNQQAAELSWHRRPQHASKCWVGWRQGRDQYSSNWRYDLFIQGKCPCQRQWVLIFRIPVKVFSQSRCPTQGRRADNLCQRVQSRTPWLPQSDEFGALGVYILRPRGRTLCSWNLTL